MNLCIFFEGTGQGVAGRITNVTRMRDICVDDVRLFSVERGNAFYTIYTFYTAIICVGLRNDCFRAGAETGATSRQVAAQEILSFILVPNAEI